MSSEHKTLVMTRADVEKALAMQDALDAVENVFRLYGQGRVQMPSKVYLTFDKGDLRCMPAYAPDLGFASVKNVNVHPNNKELPTVMATLTLVEPNTGFPLAIMDATHITKMRTGAAGGVAAKFLSRQDSETAGFVGAGVQAQTQLDALLLVRPKISKVLVYDVNKDNCEHLCWKNGAGHTVRFQCVDSVREAVEGADIITTTTPVNSPVVKNDYVSEGTHINAIGADAHGKQELDPQILKRARVVIDNWEQASQSGEINVPVSKGFITRKDIYCDIGEIVAKKKEGRENAGQITVFDSTGLAIQDLACAAHVYNYFKNHPELLQKLKTVDFL